jgi:hypothetical protein
MIERAVEPIEMMRVPLAVSEVALQTRSQTWQPVARHDANHGDCHSRETSRCLRPSNLLMKRLLIAISGRNYVSAKRRKDDAGRERGGG